MAVLDKDAFSDGMRKKYGKKLESYYLNEACKAAKLIKKVGGLGGSTHNFAAAVSGSFGAVDFPTAQANANVPTFEQRAITPSKEYQVGKVDNLAIALSKGDGGFTGAVDAQMKSTEEGYRYAISHQIWGNGGGARGRIASGGISSATITLSERADIVNFQKGMKLQLSSDDGTASSPAGVRSGTTLEVDSVDENAGTVTCTTNITAAIAAAAANDYIYREGDYGAVMKGILAWVPVTAPTSGDSFFGVDRSSMVVRMAGNRVTATGSSIEDAIFDACGELDLHAGSADTLFMGPLHYKELCKSIDSRAFTKVSSGNKEVLGVDAIQVASPSGTINVISDRNCPDAYGLLTKLSDWELLYAGPGCPHFEEAGGGKLRVETSNDSLEFRLKAYWQLRNKMPKNNVLLTWGS